MKGYFWYSEKQAQLIWKLQGHKNYCQLDNGEIKHYTEMNDNDKPGGRWDDYVFLGHGEYHHTVK